MAAPTQATPAVTKGTAIGETINAAINAALPGVSALEKIFEALFHKSSTEVSDNTKTTVQAGTVKTAVNSATTDAVNAVTAKLTELTTAIEEIESVNNIADMAEKASSNLPSKQLLTISDGLGQFKEQWKTAKPLIQDLLKADTSKITNVSILSDLENFDQTGDTLIASVETNIINATAPIPDSNLQVGLSDFSELASAVRKLTTGPSVQLKVLAFQIGLIKAPLPAAATA